MAVVSAFPVQAQWGRIAFSDAGDFSEAAIVRGVQATQAQCAAASHAVWAQVPGGEAECIQYWTAGFDVLPARRAVVFFHGDVYVGTGKTGRSYLEQSSAGLQRNADVWAQRLGVPYIFVGRPGTHGSSGDHMQRRRRLESELISAAMDVLKQRYGIEEWVAAGQSGGGHVTSALLTLRGDIVCAVPTSAVSSPRIRWQMMGRSRDTTNYADAYEPTEHLDKGRMHPQLRVFVLGDPDDRNVFWPAQTVMADALRQAQVPVQVLTGTGLGPQFHALPNAARTVAGWCARDFGTDEILERVARGLKG